jgi:hypothetical protein
LLFNRACFRERVFIPVSGIKVITTDNRTITVDYGKGACDNGVTITADGEEPREVDLSRSR